MSWEENEGRNELNLLIGGRRQSFPGRRTVVGNNETSLGETGDVNIRVREIELLEYSFSCFR